MTNPLLNLAFIAHMTGAELGCDSYGPGEIIGTRGRYVVLHKSGEMKVTFAEF